MRETLPRLYELKDLLADRLTPNAFLQNLEQGINEASKREALVRLERQLAVLDDDGWRDLKARAAHHLQSRDPIRQGQPLFDVFSEAHGFAYLKAIGATAIRFIPQSKVRTPDLEGFLSGRPVLCEVKTINISQDEALLRLYMQQGGLVDREMTTRLDAGLLRKLDLDLTEAIKQLDTRDPEQAAKRVVFVVVYFDDPFAEHQREYFDQIDKHVLANPVKDAELVLCPARNFFGHTFRMRSAAMFDPETGTLTNQAGD